MYIPIYIYIHTYMYTIISICICHKHAPVCQHHRTPAGRQPFLVLPRSVLLPPLSTPGEPASTEKVPVVPTVSVMQGIGCVPPLPSLDSWRAPFPVIPTFSIK